MKKLSKRLLSVLLSVLMVLTVMPFTATTVHADAQSDYLAKIADMKTKGTVYTNMLPAYLAYVAVQSDASAENIAKLQTAVDDMQIFNHKTGNQDVYINSKAEGYYGNVLYTDHDSTKTDVQYSDAAHAYVWWDNGTLSYGLDMFVYQPGGVVLYDGETDAELPVLFAEQENEGRYSFRLSYVLESEGRVKQDWIGRTTAARNGTSSDVAIVWPTVTMDNYSYYISHESGTGHYYDAGAHDTYSPFYNFKSSLVFDIDDGADYTSILDRVQYNRIANYKKVSKFEWSTRPYWTNLVTGNEHIAYGDTIFNTTNPVYILNYKKLLDKMQIAINKYKDQSIMDVNGTDFNTGVSTGLFAAFDNATSIDFTDSTKWNFADTENTVIAAAAKIDDAVRDFDEIEGTAATMQSLVSNINKYEAMMKENPYRKNLAKTYKLYIKAKEFFDGYIFGQKNDSDDDADYLSALSTLASNFEVAIADFIPFAKYNKTTQKYELTGVSASYIQPGTGHFFDEDGKSGSSARQYYYTDTETARNILYYEQSNIGSPLYENNYMGKSIDGNDVTTAFRIYYSPKTVILYNGMQNARIPVMGTAANKNNSANFFSTESFIGYWYPTSHEALTTLIKPTNSTGISNINKFSSQYQYADSSEFHIMENHSTITRAWYGVELNETARLDFEGAYSLGYTPQSSNGAITAGLGLNPGQDIRLKVGRQGSKFSSVAASGMEYVDPYFANVTDSTAVGDKYDKRYTSINWCMAWVESGGTASSRWREGISTANATIDVLNVKPIIDAQGTLLDNTDAQAILQRIFLYDEDTADVIAFLEKIDSVGSFDPTNSKYNYAGADTSSYTYSPNPGIESCVADMLVAVDTFSNVADAVDSTNTGIVNNTVPGNGKIIVPTGDELTKESTSTETDASKLDANTWYDKLRIALLDPLEEDACYPTTEWNAYVDALSAAQTAIATPATTANSYYPKNPVSGVDKTYSTYADELNAAKTALLAAPGQHSYLYDDEDEDQLSEWECQYNAGHVHGNADMSAYNELEIAYNTIDQKAYEAEAKTDMESAYNNDFKTVKTEPTDKGQTPQNYVDNGIVDLLTAINNAATGGEEGSSQLNTFNVNFNVVIDGDEENPVKVLENQPMNYGTTTAFVATEAAGFPADSICYKWTVKIGSNDAQTIYHNSNTLSNFVQDNTTVTAYVNSATPAEKVKVMIYGPTKLKLYEINVDKNAAVNFGSVDANGNLTVTIDGKNYTVASTPAYLNTNWTIGVEQNEEVYEGGFYSTYETDENGDELAVDRPYTVEYLRAKRGLSYLKIYPHFTQRITNGYTVTASGSTDATIIVNGQDKQSKEVTGVVYDDKVRIQYNPVTDEDDEDYKGEFYGIAINVSEMAGGTTARYVPISYGTEFYFRANSIMNVYPIYKTVVQKGDSTANVYTVDDASQTKITNPTDRYYLNRHLPFVVDLFDTNNVNGKYVFRVMFTQNLPDTVEITEHGYTYLRLSDSRVVDYISAGESDIVYGKTFTFHAYEDPVTHETIGADIDGTTYEVKQKPASKTYDPDSHQFSFSASKAPTGTYAYQASRGYVKFTYDFTAPVIDANEDPMSAPIEAISYGRADFYTNN